MSTAPVTELLQRAAGGDAGARDALLAAVYPELRRLARRLLVGDRMRQQIQVFQQAWSLRQDDEASVFLPWMAEEALAGDLALQAPHFLVGLATQLQPAWTGRGHVWLTALFEKIGVDEVQLARAIVRYRPARLPKALR